MELCSNCPMRDERYIPTDQAEKIRIRELDHALQRRGDFIEWLFEHSEHCDHISYNEAWDEFTEFENKKD